MSIEHLGTDQKCSTCKKKFTTFVSGYLYQLSRQGKYHWFCSYTCMRKFEKKESYSKYIEMIDNAIYELNNKNKLSIKAMRDCSDLYVAFTTKLDYLDTLYNITLQNKEELIKYKEN